MAGCVLAAASLRAVRLTGRLLVPLCVQAGVLPRILLFGPAPVPCLRHVCVCSRGCSSCPTSVGRTLCFNSCYTQSMPVPCYCPSLEGVREKREAQ